MLLPLPPFKEKDTPRVIVDKANVSAWGKKPKTDFWFLLILLVEFGLGVGRQQNLKMGSLYRSELMSKCQIFLQIDAAFVSVAQLGELGLVQFRDVSSQVLS